ncbi:MAG: prepilin-type N-terminal cleavage/methylation protein [Verrucomicrobia bacterium]|nr:prepilin-type N-terminal cleavage/methylation protein [Verrucomicrobiota bacterium]
MKKSRTTGAFTLIELIVVIGIIGAASGLVAAGFRDPGAGTALRGGRAVVAQLLVLARDKAVLDNRRTMLAVDADPAGEGFLRRISVVVETAPDSQTWFASGAGEVLPEGVFVVPGGSDADLATVPEGVVWPDRVRSTLRSARADEVIPGVDAGVRKFLLMPEAFEIDPAHSPDVRWVLTVGRRISGGVMFTNPSSSVGVGLSAYGVPLSLDDAPGFEL